MGCTGNCKASQLMLFFIVIHWSGLWHLLPSRTPWFTQWAFWFSSLEGRSPSILWHLGGSSWKKNWQQRGLWCLLADSLHLKDTLVSVRAEYLPLVGALCALNMIIVNAHFTADWFSQAKACREETSPFQLPCATLAAHGGHESLLPGWMKKPPCTGTA